jgi:hypothetical protein
MTMSLYAVTFDCTNAADLARFWSDVLGRPVDADPSEEFAAISHGGESPAVPCWMFNKVSEPKRTKNRVHVDLVSGDWKAEVDRVIALGATRIGDFDEGGSTWTTLSDPEGNEFDIAAAQQ